MATGVVELTQFLLFWGGKTSSILQNRLGTSQNTRDCIKIDIDYLYRDIRTINSGCNCNA